MILANRFKTILFGEKLIVLASIIGFACVMAAVTVLFSSRSDLHELLYNSDSLYPSALYQDLQAGGNYQHWYAPPNNYYFPDKAAYFFLRAILGNTHLAIFGSMVVLQTLYMVGVGLCAHVFYGSHRLTAWCILASALLLVLSISASIIPPTIFALEFHFGTLAVLPWAVLLVLQSIKARSASIKLLLTTICFGLCSLMVLSDLVFIVQVILPLLATLLFAAWIKKERVAKYGHILTCLVLSVPAGYVFGKLSHPLTSDFIYFPAQFTMSISHMRAVLRNIVDWLLDFARQQPLLALVWASFLIIALMIVVGAVRARIQNKAVTQHNGLWCLIFSLVCVFFNFAATLVTAFGPRVVYPAIILPLIYGWIMLAGYAIAHQPQRTRFSRTSYVISIVDCMLLVALIAWSLPNFVQASPKAELSDYYPAFVRCLDENARARNLQYGLAHYWQAKYVTVLSKNNIVLAQVTKELTPFNWLTTQDNYTHTPQFIIVDQKPPTPRYLFPMDRILAQYGTPADTFICENSQILVYNRDTDVAFHEQFKASPR